MSVNLRNPFQIRLEQFEGPLDLLLYLIQEHELSISKLAISQITDQYLRFVQAMEALDFEIAADFLLMAATLIQWKSASLLPLDPSKKSLETEDDESFLTPEKLIEQLKEHRKFLDMGHELSQRPHLGIDYFTRSNSKPPVHKIWREMQLTSLTLTYQDTLARSRKRGHILKKETVSLADKIRDLSQHLSFSQWTSFRSLLFGRLSRAESVVTFLASLELSRLKKTRLHQEKTYDDIYIELIESLDQFDPMLMTGFENLAQQTQESTLEGPRA